MGPKPPDIAIGAMVREAQPVAPRMSTPEQRLSRRVAEKVRENNWREGMSLARGNTPEQRKSNQRIEQIGVVRGSDGTKTRTTAEQGRFDKAKAADGLVRKFFGEGYDKLNAATEQPKIRDAVLNAARRRPQLAAEINKIAGNQAKLKAYAERMIKEDPKFAAEAAKNFDQWIASPDIADIVTPAQQKVDELTAERDDKNLDLDDINRRFTQVNDRLKAFDRSAVPPGALAKEMDSTRGNLTTLKTELAQHTQEADVYQSRLDQLKTEISTIRSGSRTGDLINTDIIDVTQKLRDARLATAEREAKITRLTELETQEQELMQQKGQAEKDRRTKELDIKKTDLELSRRIGDLADAKALRESQELDIMDGVENIFGKAAEGVLDSQVEAFLQAADEEVEAFSEQAKEANQKAVHDILRKRYTKIVMRGIFRKEAKTVIDRQHVDQDYAVLMKSGPEAVMVSILGNSTNPVTGTNYTVAEAEALLKDPDYVANAQPVVLRHLLTRRIATSGMTQEDVDVVVMSPWGEGIIADALSKRAEVRTAAEGLIGEGALKGKGFMDKLKQAAGKHPGWWFMLMGLGLLPAIAALKMPLEEQTPLAA